MNPLATRITRRALYGPGLRWTAAIFALANAVVVLTHLARLPDVRAAQKPGTGDFLAFYVGASLVATGDGHRLYDLPAQQQVQAQIQGGPRPYAQVYLNPPALAVALAPTTALGFRVSYLLFCATTGASLLVAVWAARRFTPHLTDTPTLLACTLAVPSVARAAAGGQNTLITLALLAGLLGALRRGRWIAAGVLLGVLSYKPQHALIGATLLVGAPAPARVLAVAGGVALAHYGLGASVAGPAWPIAFLDHVLQYRAIELAEDQPNHVSLPRVLGAPGVGLSLLLLTISLRDLRRARAVDGPAAAAAWIAAMLSSPHLQYYDALLAWVPLLLVLEHRARRQALDEPSRAAVLLGVLGLEAAGAAMARGVQVIPVVLLALWAAATAENAYSKPSARPP